MLNVKDCPGLETFGADVRVARENQHLAHKVPAER